MRAIKIGQAMLIGREVRWHPVQNHRDSTIMQAVHQIHEILRRAIARGGSEIPGGLISPGTVERMLHHGKQLDVGEVHALSVIGEARRHLAITERTIIFLRNPHPGTEMDFVDGNRRMQGISPFAILHPVAISPLVVEIPQDRSGARRFLMPEAERVCFVDYESVVPRNDVKLINRTLDHSGDEPLPNARTLANTQGMGEGIPAIKAANHAYCARVRSPHAEACARLVADGSKMGSQLLVCAIVTPLVKKIKILLGQESHFSATSRSGLDSSLGIRVSRVLILAEQRLVYWNGAVGV